MFESIQLSRCSDLVTPSLEDIVRDWKQAAAAMLPLAIAEAAKETDTTASEAQHAAGNYRKGRVRIHGMTVVIENPKGSVRSGTDKGGKKWSTTMAHHYGYIANSRGADEDPVDVFIGPDPESELVFVVNQVNPTTRRFDECKSLVGFTTEDDAREGYLANYEKGWKGLGSIKALTLADFKRRLGDGDFSKQAKDRWVFSCCGKEECQGCGGISRLVKRSGIEGELQATATKPDNEGAFDTTEPEATADGQNILHAQPGQPAATSPAIKTVV